MAQQTINIGTVANDGSGDTIRVGGDKINDNFTELYAFKQAIEADPVTASLLFRRKSNVACTATAGQTITYTSELINAGRPMLDDYEGLGIEITNNEYSDTGFKLTASTAGTFGYYTPIEI